MKKKLTAATLVIFLTNISFGEELKCSTKFKIYYIPINVEFYIPIKEEEIEKKAFCSFEIRSCSINELFYKEKLKIKKTGNVRIKISKVGSDESVYVTNRKEIIKNNEVLDVSSSELEKILNLVSRKGEKCKKLR